MIHITQEAKTALEGSVVKWERVFENLRAGLAAGESGSNDCPLCQLYNPHATRNIGLQPLDVVKAMS